MTPLIIRNREELEHLIVTMRRDGWAIRALARHFKMGRNTVKRILRKYKDHRDHGHDIVRSQKNPSRRTSKLDRYVPNMKKILEKYPDVTGMRMFEKLQDEGYSGGITIVRERLNVLRPHPKHEPEVRFETEPGVQSQMDWSPYTIDFAQGGKTKVLCFSYILGFSRRHYIDFTMHRDFHTLIRRHRDAFQHFGGVTRQCLYDGEKTVILRWEAGRPVFNPGFIAFITHYECRPIGCRPGRAKTKGKVEEPFQYVEKNLLNARTFSNLDDLKGTARWWLREKSDMHIHDTTGHPPLELFLQREAQALLPLPPHPYDCSEVALRICSSDGFLELETNRYSVPYEYIGEILTMKATEKEIFIYSPEIEIIGCHERFPYGAGKSHEDPAHRNSPKIRYGLEPVRETFLRLGYAAETFLEGLKNAHPKNCGFHARLILQLKEQYDSQDIHRACVHAIRYRAFDAKAVERIVKAKATPRTLEWHRNERARKELMHTLPPITQRSLDEYCRLLNPEEPYERSDDTTD